MSSPDAPLPFQWGPAGFVEDPVTIRAFSKVLDALPLQDGPIPGVPSPMANEDGTQTLSLAPAEHFWPGLSLAMDSYTYREIALGQPDGPRSAVLEVGVQRNVLTRRKVARVTGQWVVRNEAEATATYTCLPMNQNDVARHMELIAEQTWHADPEAYAAHPRDRFSRAESAQIEGQLQRIDAVRWRPDFGYQASNRHNTGDWDIDLGMDAGGQALRGGTIMLTRREGAQNPTVLPAQVAVRFTVRRRGLSRLVDGSRLHEGLTFTTPFREVPGSYYKEADVVILDAKQRAELRDVLASVVTEDSLRPDPSRPEFAVPLKTSLQMARNAHELVWRPACNRQPAGSPPGEAVRVFSTRDAPGRPATIVVHDSGHDRFTVEYTCYDPTSFAGRPDTQLRHQMTFTAAGIESHRVIVMNRDNLQDAAYSVLDAGERPDLAMIRQAYRSPEDAPTPQDIAQTVAGQLRYLAGSGARSRWGSAALPTS